MLFKVSVSILLLMVAHLESKIYNNCELGRELLQRWPSFFNRNNIHTWVCIVQYESRFNTAAVSPRNRDGSRDYGLFQVNDRYWCGRGKDCGIPCSALTADSITASVQCIQKIFSRHGFSAWTTWTNRCRNDGTAKATTRGCNL